MKAKMEEAVANLRASKATNAFQLGKKRRITEIDHELKELQQKHQSLADKSDSQAIEIEERKTLLELEQQRLTHLMEELDAKEREMKQKEQEHAALIQVMQARIDVFNSAQHLIPPQAVNALKDVQDTGDKVKFYQRKWEQLQFKTADILHKLVKSKQKMQDNVESLEDLLASFEQQVPYLETKIFNELLQAIQHVNPNTQRKKCFISYAWNSDKRENTLLQAKLIRLKNTLSKAGIEAMLDILNMEGDINDYMIGNIQNCDRVLLICTPRLKARIDEVCKTPNNLQKEYQAALTRQAQNPKFIIPLIYEGKRREAISESLPNILALDFTDPLQYRDILTSLNPKGLIPMILGLEDNPAYAIMLEWYKQMINKEREKENDVQQTQNHHQ